MHEMSSLGELSRTTNEPADAMPEWLGVGKVGVAISPLRTASVEPAPSVFGGELKRRYPFCQAFVT
jgi:hypothetical protein